MSLTILDFKGALAMANGLQPHILVVYNSACAYTDVFQLSEIENNEMIVRLAPQWRAGTRHQLSSMRVKQEEDHSPTMRCLGLLGTSEDH